MSQTLYVGGLADTISEIILRAEFARFGEVTFVTVIRNKYSSKSKGFGFVKMANDFEANKAMMSLNGIELDGRRIQVDYARTRNNCRPPQY